MELLKPFGPCIGRTEMGPALTSMLNAYVDDVARGAHQAELNHGPRLIGFITEEITFPEAALSTLEFADLAEFLSESVRSYVALFRRDGLPVLSSSAGVALVGWDMWVMRQFAGDYNPIHTHSNFDVSGVAYLKVPTSVAGHKGRRDKQGKHGTLHFVHGSDQFLCEARHSVRPTEGAMYLFPSYLMHAVYPFFGPGERRSFAFNVRVRM